MFFTIELAAKDKDLLEVAGYLESEVDSEKDFIVNMGNSIKELPEIESNPELKDRFVIKDGKLIFNQIEVKALCALLNLFMHNFGIFIETRFAKNCRFLPSEDIKSILSMRLNQLLD